MNEWFVIKNIEEFTNKARAIVYNNFGNWENESYVDDIIDSVKHSEQSDFDKVLSHQESLVIIKQIIKKQKNKTTSKIRYILNETLFAKIVEALNARMVSNILNELVKKGLIESAYDTESNDFVFWVKNDLSTNKKSETN